MSKRTILIWIGIVSIVVGVIYQVKHDERVNDKTARCKSVGGHYSIFGTGKCYINGEEVFKDE